MKLKTLAVLSCMPLVGCLGEVQPELGVDEEAVVGPIVTSPAGGGRFLALRANYVDQRFYAGTDISGLMLGTPVAGGLASAPDTWRWENYAEPGAAAPVGPAPATYEGIATGEIHDIGFVAGTEMVFAATPDGLYRRAMAASNWQLVFGGDAPSIPDATLSALVGTATTFSTSCGLVPQPPWCDSRSGFGWRPASVQAVAVSRRTPAATSIVWLGMGERRSVNQGLHHDHQPYLVYRSLDSGTTWEPVFSIHLNTPTTSPLTRVGPMINGIEADPLYPNVVYLATDMGLYRTTNGLAPALDVVWTELGRPTVDTVQAGRYAPLLGRSWAFPERVVGPPVPGPMPMPADAADSNIYLPVYDHAEGAPITIGVSPTATTVTPIVAETHPNVRDLALGRDATGTSYVHVVIDSNAVGPSALCGSAATIINHRLASNAYSSTDGFRWERRIAALDVPPHQVTCAPGHVDGENTHYTSIQATGHDIAISRYSKSGNASGGAYIHVGPSWDVLPTGTCLSFESGVHMGFWGDGVGCTPSDGLDAQPMSWDLWVQNWGMPTPLMPAVGPVSVLMSSDRNIQRYWQAGGGIGHFDHMLDQEDAVLTSAAMGSSYIAAPSAHFWRAQGPSNVLVNTRLIRLGTRHYVGTEDAGLLVTPNNGASWGRVNRIHSAALPTGGAFFDGSSLVADPRLTPNRLFTARRFPGSPAPPNQLAWIDDNAAADRSSYVWTTLTDTRPDLVIQQIALDPRGPGRVLVATNLGLFGVDTNLGVGATMIPIAPGNMTHLVPYPGAAGTTYAAYAIEGRDLVHINLDTSGKTLLATIDSNWTFGTLALGSATAPRLYIGTFSSGAGYLLEYLDVNPAAPVAVPSPAPWWPTPFTHATSMPGMIGNTLPSPTGSRLMDGRAFDDRWRPNAIAVDPANPMHALVGFGGFQGMWPTAIFETTTAGYEWHVAQQYATIPQKVIHAITFLDGRVYFSTGNGIVGF